MNLRVSKVSFSPSPHFFCLFAFFFFLLSLFLPQDSLKASQVPSNSGRGSCQGLVVPVSGNPREWKGT